MLKWLNKYVILYPVIIYEFFRHLYTIAGSDQNKKKIPLTFGVFDICSSYSVRQHIYEKMLLFCYLFATVH